MTFKAYSLKRVIASLVILVTLDVFVTYHGWWQRIVVILTLSVVINCAEIWAKDDERKRMNPPRSY